MTSDNEERLERYYAQNPLAHIQWPAQDYLQAVPERHTSITLTEDTLKQLMESLQAHKFTVEFEHDREAWLKPMGKKESYWDNGWTSASTSSTDWTSANWYTLGDQKLDYERELRLKEEAEHMAELAEAGAISLDLEKLDWLTRYPQMGSLFGYDEATKRLTDQVFLPEPPEQVLAVEWIDGLDMRLIFMPGQAWLAFPGEPWVAQADWGSLENRYSWFRPLLANLRRYNPRGKKSLYVLYFTVYGGTLGKHPGYYTSKATSGAARLRDVGRWTLKQVEQAMKVTLPELQVAWAERRGPTGSWSMVTDASFMCNIATVPAYWTGASNTLESTLRAIRQLIRMQAGTPVRLDAQAKNRIYGLVLRSVDGGYMTGVRYRDIENTLALRNKAARHA